MAHKSDETREAFESLQAMAAGTRHRIEDDAEGWPVINGTFGRIEYHDGRDLAVWFESARCPSQVARYVTAGCRPHQVGDSEARLLFAPSLLGTIARMIRACYRTIITEAMRKNGRAQRKHLKPRARRVATTTFSG